MAQQGQNLDWTQDLAQEVAGKLARLEVVLSNKVRTFSPYDLQRYSLITADQTLRLVSEPGALAKFKSEVEQKGY